jgi:5,10-methenyltetrahydrofolate synthetase
VATECIIASAFEDGKEVLVPVMPNGVPNEVPSDMPEVSTILLHTHISPATRFISDSFGIPTPAYFVDNLLQPASYLDSHDCIIVPLLGFDEECYRLGYGKGHYDRFLAEVLAHIPSIQTIGLGYECQRVERVITEPHDILLSTIISEKRVYVSL